jgi:hypothetical protein
MLAALEPFLDIEVNAPATAATVLPHRLGAVFGQMASKNRGGSAGFTVAHWRPVGS